MQPTARSLLALSLALLAAGCAALPETSAPTDLVIIDRTKALQRVNAFRAENGMPALRMEDRLMVAALAQSRAMAKKNRMDHAVDGVLPDRVRAAGYDWTTTAENIAQSYRDYDRAMAGWVASPGHRKNLLNPDVTEIGFAGARAPDGRPYWTQIFGRPRGR
ncbi:hypothetical protein ASG43_01725 [Aureimonas sp. Leaf454]|uniref:CAP domain-containing protein n=1 Tax=Aureimonas sp. Leaf454 TaxID=1736381 RepID=UPI0006FD808A|nr:CAP domain-containing protein [Aureimonas sp. Leaf454]KQT54353.1 hypothetical protein ASG43_01725 [Aureimonas sp. Leaf454]